MPVVRARWLLLQLDVTVLLMKIDWKLKSVVVN